MFDGVYGECDSVSAKAPTVDLLSDFKWGDWLIMLDEWSLAIPATKLFVF